MTFLLFLILFFLINAKEILSEKEIEKPVEVFGSQHLQEDLQSSKNNVELLFKEIDSNNDGVVEREEIFNFIKGSLMLLHKETAYEEFHKINENKSDKISLDQYVLFAHNDPLTVLENMTLFDNSEKSIKLKKNLHFDKDRFKAADRDGDGLLDKEEYVCFKYPLFFPHMAHTIINDYMEDLDVNKDGTIDKKEYINHFHVDDNKDIAAKEKSLKKTEENFAEADKDKNGKIDKQEYFDVLKPGYDETASTEADYLINESDNNKDGMLTLKEIEKHGPGWVSEDSNVGNDQGMYDESQTHLEDEL